ncbi:MAG: Maf family protein [Candidatus Pacebacteria bacterium]|nr:Maf family protein [Candidatus Paceibacterota bacterium]
MHGERNSRLILASASPRRAALLRDMGFSVKVVPADIDETPNPEESPRDMVRRLARLKAARVAPRFPRDIVLAADTIIVHNGVLMGKPSSIEDARTMLETLSGNVHEVLTGVCLRRDVPYSEECWVSSTSVTFLRLTPAIIDAYIKRVKVLDKAGAYAIQEHGEMLIADIQGLRSNVIGLPVEDVLQRLA